MLQILLLRSADFFTSLFDLATLTFSFFLLHQWKSSANNSTKVIATVGGVNYCNNDLLCFFGKFICFPRLPLDAVSYFCYYCFSSLLIFFLVYFLDNSCCSADFGLQCFWACFKLFGSGMLQKVYTPDTKNCNRSMNEWSLNERVKSGQTNNNLARLPAKSFH